MSTARPQDNQPSRSPGSRRGAAAGRGAGRRGRDLGPALGDEGHDADDIQWFKYLGEGRPGGQDSGEPDAGSERPGPAGRRRAAERPAVPPVPPSASLPPRGEGRPDSATAGWDRPEVAARGRNSGSWDRPEAAGQGRNTGSWDRPEPGVPGRDSGTWNTPPAGRPGLPESMTAAWERPAPGPERADSVGWDLADTNPRGRPVTGPGGRNTGSWDPSDPLGLDAAGYGQRDQFESVPSRGPDSRPPDRPRPAPRTGRAGQAGTRAGRGTDWAPADPVSHRAPAEPAGYGPAGEPVGYGVPADQLGFHTPADHRGYGAQAGPDPYGSPAEPVGYTGWAAAPGYGAADEPAGYTDRASYTDPAGYGLGSRAEAPRSDRTAQLRRPKRAQAGRPAASPYSAPADHWRPDEGRAGQGGAGQHGAVREELSSDPGYLPLDYTSVPYTPFEGGNGERRPGGQHPDLGDGADRPAPRRGHLDETIPGGRSAGGAGGGVPVWRPQDEGPGDSRYPAGGFPESEDRYAGWMDPSQEQFDLTGTGEWTRANRAWSGRGQDTVQVNGAPIGVSGLEPSPRTTRTDPRSKKRLGKTTQVRKVSAKRGPEPETSDDLRDRPTARPDRARRKRAARPDPAAGRRSAGTARGRSAGGVRSPVKMIVASAAAIARLPGRILIGGGVAVVAVVAVAGYFLFSSSPGPSHVISVPASFGGYTQSPSLATATHETALQKAIVSGAGGEVKNVKSQVYEQAAAPGSKASPQIMGFIGGNLTGGSASTMISDVMSLMRGSFSTGPGRLGGQAACATGTHGGPAICAWADNDTFGVVFSPTLSPSGLAAVMRQLRPLAEHLTK